MMRYQAVDQTRILRLLMAVLGGLISVTIGTQSAIPQETNFGKLVLNASKSSGALRGRTGGTTSLPDIISRTDSQRKKCLGFGDPKPDHLITLQQDFLSLTLRVTSNGGNTTLVVQGSDGTIRCDDDSPNRPDAQISDTSWKAGLYKVWVGTTTPGLRKNYTLTVQP
jgi:hypothetical protein